MTTDVVSFSIIGPGRVGSSLASALINRRWVCKDIVYDERALRMKAQVVRSLPGAKLVKSTGLLRDNFEILFVTVNDDAIAGVAAQLMRNSSVNWRGKTVFHMSGIVGVNVLEPLAKRGAAVGALHPLAAFPRPLHPEGAMNIRFDFLGSRKALTDARKVSTVLNSKLIVLKSEFEKVNLHLASVIATNFVTIAAQAAAGLANSSIGKRETKLIIDGLLASAVSNISSLDGLSALSGPLIRGDVEVISKHLSALKDSETLLAFYKAASRLGVESLLREKKLKTLAPKYRRIRDILSK